MVDVLAPGTAPELVPSACPTSRMENRARVRPRHPDTAHRMGERNPHPHLRQRRDSQPLHHTPNGGGRPETHRWGSRTGLPALVRQRMVPVPARGGCLLSLQAGRGRRLAPHRRRRSDPRHDALPARRPHRAPRLLGIQIRAATGRILTPRVSGAPPARPFRRIVPIVATDARALEGEAGARRMQRLHEDIERESTADADPAATSPRPAAEPPSDARGTGQGPSAEAGDPAEPE